MIKTLYEWRTTKGAEGILIEDWKERGRKRPVLVIDTGDYMCRVGTFTSKADADLFAKNFNSMTGAKNEET